MSHQRFFSNLLLLTFLFGVFLIVSELLIQEFLDIKCIFITTDAEWLAYSLVNFLKNILFRFLRRVFNQL